MKSFTLIFSVKLNYSLSQASPVSIVTFNSFSITQTNTNFSTLYSILLTINNTENISNATWYNLALRVTQEQSYANINSSLFSIFVNANKASAIYKFDPSLQTGNVITFNNNSTPLTGIVMDISYVRLFTTGISDGMILENYNNIDFSTNIHSLLSYFDMRLFVSTDIFESIRNNIQIPGVNVLSLSQGTLLMSHSPKCGSNSYFDSTTNSCTFKKYLYFSGTSTPFSIPYQRTVSLSTYSFELWFNIESSTAGNSGLLTDNTSTGAFTVKIVSGKISININSFADSVVQSVISKGWNYVGFTAYGNNVNYYRLFINSVGTEDVFITSTSPEKKVKNHMK